MNYKYQFAGADTNCTPPGDGLHDYSRGTRIDLDELALNEFAGTCGSPSYDWNQSGTLQNPVVFEINVDSGGTPQNSGCAAALGTLRDSNDRAAIVFTGLGDSDLRSELEKTIIDCDNPAP